MSDEARRKILEAVAAGRMDPGDAADALADLDSPAEPDEGPPSVDRAGGEEHVTPVTRIKVSGNFRSVEVIGDEGVREAVAEGPHRIRWEGDVLVIDGASGFDDDDDDGFDWDGRSDGERPQFGEWFRTNGPRHIRRVGMAYSRQHGGPHPRPLRVRMNPTLPLEARVEAGPLTIRRVRGPMKARVSAGPLIIEGFESPIDLRVAAGKVDARGRLQHGVSTIDCDAGKVRLHLERGSDARVSASATLGKVDFGGRVHRDERRGDWAHRLRDHGLGDSELSGLGERLATMLNDAFSDEREVVVGRGTAVVDVRVSMGAADITFDDEASE